jgi:hypothetical protein
MRPTMKIWLLVSTLLLFKMSLSAMPNVYVCAGEIVNLDSFFANNAKGKALYWRHANIEIGLDSAGVGPIPYFTAVNGTTESIIDTLSCIIINAQGVAKTVDFTLTIRPKPLVMMPSLAAVVCNGNIFSQTLESTPKGAHFNLTGDNQDVSLLGIANSNGLNFSAFNEKQEKRTTNMSITPILNGCVGLSQFMELSVLPTPSVSMPSDTVLCSGDVMTTVFSSDFKETVFNWTNDNPATGVPARGSGSLNFRTVANLTGEDQVANIIVTPRLNGCDGTPKMFRITVKPAPILATTAYGVCVNDSGYIDLKTNLKLQKETVFSWVSDNINTGIPPMGNDSLLIFKALSNKLTEVITAKLIVLAKTDGCKARTQVAVNIKPRPVLYNPGNLFIAAGQRVKLHFLGDTEGTVFDWTNDKVAIGLPLSGSGDFDFSAKSNFSKTALTANIIVTPSLDGCTELPQMFTVTLPPTPSVSTPLATIPNKRDD